jgi:UMP-CMP kinase
MKETLANPPTFPEGSALANGWKDGKGRFLIDGFPRKQDQADMFDQSVSERERRLHRSVD